MNQQSGFTLFELMIAIAVVAILSAIGVPAYQGYVQKAAMTDMLQTMIPYKTAVEMCVLEQGSVQGCNSGSNGIGMGKKATRYVSQVSVTNGVIVLDGQSALQGLTVTLTPEFEASSGDLAWRRNCASAAANESLLSACNGVFRFNGQD